MQKYICKLFLDKETIIYYILGGLFANFLGLFAVFLRLSASFCVFPGLIIIIKKTPWQCMGSLLYIVLLSTVYCIFMIY